MIIKFDPQRMLVLVQGGLGEKFEPCENTELIRKKVDELRNTIKKFQDGIIGPSIEEINQLVKEYNKPLIEKSKTEE